MVASTVGTQCGVGHLYLRIATGIFDEASLANKKTHFVGSGLLGSTLVSDLFCLPSLSVFRSSFGVLTACCCRGIVASIASLVERVEVTHSVDTTWIAAILSLCR